MPAAWVGTLGILAESVRAGTFTTEIVESFRKLFGDPGYAELSAWQHSIPALVDALSPVASPNVLTILEFQMPVGAERADVVLLGGDSGSPTAAVIELKQWSSGIADAETWEITVPGERPAQHPALQVLNYSGKLHLFHSLGQSYAIRPYVFAQNMSRDAWERIQSVLPRRISESVGFIGKDDAASFRALALGLNPATMVGANTPSASPARAARPLTVEDARAFLEAPYEQTQHLVDVLSKYSKEIAERAEDVLAEAGVGLTEEQELSVEDILKAARSAENRAFVVQGGPGSGKTYIAVRLLLRALEQQIRCVLALRNSRLQGVLRRCFNRSYPGAAGAILFIRPRREQEWRIPPSPGNSISLSWTKRSGCG